MSATRNAVGSSLLPAPMDDTMGTPAAKAASTRAIFALTVSIASIT